jgi:hypothetical protein
VCLCFDIEGFGSNAAGKILYGVGIEVADSKGDVLFKKAPSHLEVPGANGKPLPACAKVDVGLAQPLGTYELKVTVTDWATGTTNSVTRSYELLPLEFGIVRLSVTSDREGKNAAAVLSQGRPSWINFSAVGFGRDKERGQPRVTATMQVLDQDGRSVLHEPSSGKVDHGVPAKVGAIPMQFRLALTQTGRFTVELKATDEMTGRTATVTFPIQVVASK